MTRRHRKNHSHKKTVKKSFTTTDYILPTNVEIKMFKMLNKTV